MAALARAPGFRVDIRPDMDAWLKCHVALLMPSLAPALCAAGTDNYRMARTRDAIVLALRAMREGFRGLRTLAWVPEPILVPLLQRRLADEMMEVAMVRHAEADRDEVKHLADEFLALARQTSIPTPAIDRLYAHLDPDTPTIPERRAGIPLDWRPVWVIVGAVAGVVAVLAVAVRLLKGGRTE